MPPERSAELHRTYAFILNQPRTLNSPLSILLLPVCLPLLASIISVAHHLLLNPPCRANNKYQTPRTTIPIINSPFLICKSTFLIIIINPLRVFHLKIRIWPNSTPLWSAPSSIANYRHLYILYVIRTSVALFNILTPQEPHRDYREQLFTRQHLHPSSINHLVRLSCPTPLKQLVRPTSPQPIARLIIPHLNHDRSVRFRVINSVELKLERAKHESSHNNASTFASISARP